jgi:hypothetical protein
VGLRSYVDELATQLANVEWAQRTRESRMKWVIVLELELLVVMIGTAALLSRVQMRGYATVTSGSASASSRAT